MIIKKNVIITKNEISHTERMNNNMSRRGRVKVDRETEVVVMNLTSGAFFYKDPKTFNRYTLSNFGDIEYMTVNELLTMKNRHRAYLENMWIVIIDVLDDEYTVGDVVKFLRLENAYDNPIKAENIDKFIKTSNVDEFEHVVSATDSGFSKRIAERVLQLYKNGSFKDMNKVSIVGRYSGNANLLEDLNGDV